MFFVQFRVALDCDLKNYHLMFQINPNRFSRNRSFGHDTEFLSHHVFYPAGMNERRSHHHPPSAVTTDYDHLCSSGLEIQIDLYNSLGKIQSRPGTWLKTKW